jgi:hypothetical protein
MSVETTLQFLLCRHLAPPLTRTWVYTLEKRPSGEKITKKKKTTIKIFHESLMQTQPRSREEQEHEQKD